MILEGERIRLRAVEPSDRQLLYKWENDTSLWRCSDAIEPYSHYEITNFIQQQRKGNLFETGQLRLMIELKEEHQTIGCVDFYDFQPRFSRGEVAFLIDTSHQQKGYATEALKLFRDYLFNFLHIHQLYAYVIPSNIPSLKVCQSSGFQCQGVLRDWFRDDKGWHDAQLLCCMKVE